MCRKNLLTLSWLGAFAGLALFFVGCPAAQVSHAPVAFWTPRDLDDVKAHFEGRLQPYEKSDISGMSFSRELRISNITHHEAHMAEVLIEMKHHLKHLVEKKGAEVGPVKETRESFEFDYRRGKTSGIVRCEFKHHPFHREHFDLTCHVTEHHIQVQ